MLYKNWFLVLPFIFVLNLEKAEAFISVIDSGELVPKDQYRLILEPQMGHYNLTAHFDAGLSEATQVRASLGSGENGSHLDFSFKSIPFPDIDRQPAFGYKIGTIFSNDNGTSGFTLQFTPLMSKTFNNHQNRWTPYFAIPFGITMVDRKTTNPVHAVIGSELLFPSAPDMQLGFELGSSIRDSFSYISFFVSFYFEPTDSVAD